MSWLSRLRRRPDDDFAREIESHLALEADEARERGASDEDATSAARRAFGNVTRAREQFHERSPFFPVESLWQDVRYGWRALWRTPMVTLVAVLSLTLGIGANTAVFTLVKTTVLQPLAIPEPDRVFAARWSGAADRMGFAFRGSHVRRIREAARPLADVATFGYWGWPLEVDGTKARTAGVSIVSAEYFDVLDVRPVLGRWFTAAEERRREHVVVISAALWRDRFGADPRVPGRIVKIHGLPFTIVGVAPDSLRLSAGSTGNLVVVPLSTMNDLAFDEPLDFLDDGRVPREVSSPITWLQVVVRLRPAVTVEQFESRFRALAPTADDRANGRDSYALTLVPASQVAIPFESRAALKRFLALLTGTVALVLLIGCANIASVMLARAEQRRREMAVRATLGAGRRRLARQLLTEALILAALGAGGGLLASYGMLQALRTFSLPAVPIDGLDLRPDGPVLLFLAATAIVTALVCGLVPSWRGARLDLVTDLKMLGGASGSGPGHARGLLLGVQVALSVVLLVGAGLFIRSVQRGLAVDTGYASSHVLLAGYELEGRLDQAANRDLRERLVSRVRQLPGVIAAATGESPVFSSNWRSDLTVDGVRYHLDDEHIRVAFIDAGYVEALGLRLVEGRTFTDRDLADPHVAIVNEAFVRRFLQGRPPVGRTFDATAWDPQKEKGPPALRIVGVVGNARFEDLRKRDTPVTYLLRDGNPFGWAGGATLVVRTAAPPESMMAAVAREIRALAPGQPPPTLTTVDAQVGRMLLPERMGATLLGWFSVLAVTLALLGTYGVVGYAVARRTTEIGIRMAMGASPRQVLRAILRIGLLPVALGTVGGWAAAWYATAFARQFLFEVEPRDALSFAAGGALLLISALAAAWLPARRASRIDPAVALRAE